MSKFLIGFMGSGKTTLGRALSKNAIDMDDCIQERYKRSITDYFKQSQENLFRQRETELLEELLKKDYLVSTGGGIIDNDYNRSLLMKADCVLYLKEDFEVLYKRIKLDTFNKRPLVQLLTKEELQAIYLKRQSLYEEVATYSIEIDGKTVDELVKIIKEMNYLS